MEIERYLSGYEESHAGKSGLSIVSYNGRIDLTRFRKAVEVLHQKNPILLGKLRACVDGTLLHVETKDSPILNIYQDPDFELPPEVYIEWDPTVGLSRWTLTQFEGHGLLTLRTDQSIIDGSGIIARLDELWLLYTLLENEFQVSVEESKSEVLLPRKNSELFRSRWDPDLVEPVRVSGKTNFIHSRRDRNSHRIRLTKSDTSGLIHASRVFGISVHALVSGAILVALRKLHPSLDAIPMNCISAVNLRPHASPPVKLTETTHFAVAYLSSVIVPPNASPREVGVEVMKDFRKTISRRTLKHNFLNPPNEREEVANSFRERRAILVTNLGDIRDFVAPENINITDYRLISNPQAYAITMYKDRLSIECDYIDELVSNDEADTLDEEIYANLCKIYHSLMG